MINKIFKTGLILAICVGISIPTNAAVSVSDGSAFVTKAEFSADLNNLSNRMAQLENSLDAKIDSLVSSYLTRNGIWNGARQITLTDAEKTAGGRIVFNESTAQFFYNFTAYATLTYDVLAKRSLVDSSTKSGLCFMDFEIKDSAYYVVQYACENNGVVVGTQTYWSDNVCKGAGSVIANFYLNSDTTPCATILLDNMVAGTYTQPTLNGSGRCYVRRETHFTKGKYTVSFFVSKGDKFNFEIKAYTAYSLRFDIPNEYMSSTSRGQASRAFVLYLLDCVVY